MALLFATTGLHRRYYDASLVKLAIIVTSLVLSPVTMTSTPGSGDLHTAGKSVEALDLKALAGEVTSQQHKNTTPGDKDHPATVAGLFPSQVRLSVSGEAKMAAIRKDHSVPDLTSLATLLTLSAYLEATVRGQLEKAATSDLVGALEGLDVFRAPLFGEKRSALLTFWPTETTGNASEWTTTSSNIDRGGRELRPYVILHNAVTNCKTSCPRGSAVLSHIKNNSLCFNVYNQSLSDYAKARSFPPDVTSSFANLALGVALHNGGKDYSSASGVWGTDNANFTRLVQHAHRFAYRPLSPDSSVNVIDSRSYYVIEKFLSGRTQAQLENDVFVTNWIPQSSIDGRLQYGQKSLPMYNTVDPFTTATFLRAVTSAVLSNMTASDNTLQTLMRSNLDLIAWVVSNGNKDELDLSMSAHPSVFHFYWMLSMTMFEMENARIQQLANYKALEQFYGDWNTTVRVHVKNDILKAIQDGGLDTFGNALAYVDDIIGTSDVNADGKNQPAGSDRLFATACAASSLLSAWTVYQADRTLVFLPDTPDDVALAVKRLVNYVTCRSLKEGTSLTNVIHTTVYKHCESLKFWFPSNSAVTQTGANFTGSSPSPEVLFGMRGHVASEDYNKTLAQPRFGHSVPESMPGVNSTSAVYLYWSAPAYTQAMSLLAVAHMTNVQGKAKKITTLVDSFKKKGK